MEAIQARQREAGNLLHEADRQGSEGEPQCSADRAELKSFCEELLANSSAARS